MFYQTQRPSGRGPRRWTSGRRPFRDGNGDRRIAADHPDPSGGRGQYLRLETPSRFWCNRVGGRRPQRNLIQDTFFLTRLNDNWVGTGYIVDAPLGDVGTLYRYVTTEPLTDAAKLPADFQIAIKSFRPIGAMWRTAFWIFNSARTILSGAYRPTW